MRCPKCRTELSDDSGCASDRCPFCDAIIAPDSCTHQETVGAKGPHPADDHSTSGMLRRMRRRPSFLRSLPPRRRLALAAFFGGMTAVIAPLQHYHFGRLNNAPQNEAICDASILALIIGIPALLICALANSRAANTDDGLSRTLAGVGLGLSIFVSGVGTMLFLKYGVFL